MDVCGKLCKRFILYPKGTLIVVKGLRKKSPTQTIADWKKVFMAKIEPPTVSLHNYGGGKVNTIGQLKLHVKRGPFSHELVVQTEKNGAVPLLIGTNLQSQLGFQFVQCGPESVDLVKQEPVTLAGTTALNSTSDTKPKRA